MTIASVLVFAGSDPSGGAGIAADIEAIAAQGAHALPVVTAITVQDNNRVRQVQAVDTPLLLAQALTLCDSMVISAIKIGIIANRANALALADWIINFKQSRSDIPVVLDPVLASGHGDLLSTDDAVEALQPLLTCATLITPNLPEANRLCPDGASRQQKARFLMTKGAQQVLIKGGHGNEAMVTNSWYSGDHEQHWSWPRLSGEFHGSGCTLASAIAGQLAQGVSMHEALNSAQNYCYRTLKYSYAIAPGQRIPKRNLSNDEK